MSQNHRIVEHTELEGTYKDYAGLASGPARFALVWMEFVLPSL